MNVTKEEALEALENLDDCARMDIGVEPIGPYKVLKQYIEQSTLRVCGDDIMDFLRSDAAKAADVYINHKWAYLDKFKLIELSLEHFNKGK